MQFTFPMILTLLRIALIPVLVLFFYLPYSWSSFAAAVIFIFAAVMWTERRAFSEIIDEKDKQIEALKANKEHDEEKELTNKSL